jgi:tryptophan synthase alpha chain
MKSPACAVNPSDMSANRIDSLFARLRNENRRALMPFVTAGDPDLATTASLISEIVRSGAHLIEIGIPYSDPIADGPVIAASYHRALEGGVKVGHIFQTLRTLRAEGTARFNETPLVAMVSYAIVHRVGVERFLNDAATSGLDGLIVPDLPVEESAALLDHATRRGLKLIQLITPTTPRERAVEIARSTSGFVYYVSVAGITGERKALPDAVLEAVTWLRTQTELPICVGFGISGPDQVRQLAPVADGLIVGSAIVRRLSQSINRPRGEVVQEIGQFVAELAKAL